MAGPVPLWDALRHRDFRLFYLGQSVSLVGDMVFYVALSWQVLELGGDATRLGIVLGAYMAAQVALLVVGGVVVDRFRRRNLLLASDVTQGTLVLALAALGFAGLLTFPLLVVFAILFGAAAAVAMPAMSAFVPETVPGHALASANSLYHGTRTVAMVAGPALGGLVIGVAGTAAAFALDAATFAVSIGFLVLTRGAPAPDVAGRTLVGDVREGFRYVLGVPWLWITIALFAVLNVAEAGPRNVSLPVLVADDLALDAGALGLVLSVQAIGGFLALLVVGSRPPSPERRGLVAYGAVVAAGVAFAAWAAAPGVAMLCAFAALKSAAMAVFTVTWETAIGDSVDPRVRGRVLSLDMLGSFVLLPVSMAATGAFTDAYGARLAFAIGGALIVACGLVGVLVPRARSFRKA